MAIAALVGPTAAGKTEVSIEVAERLGAEIVSLDSMQIYRGMDIGTATPSLELRARVPHHLIDELDPSHPLTAKEFQQRARAAIAGIGSRGRLPLLVGGSGLYFRAVVDDLSFPPRSNSVRRDLERRAEREGAEALYRRLAELDPAAAARIDPGNLRRVVRALEVIELTGRAFSSEAGGWDRYESRYDLRVAGLSRGRPELFERIEARVSAMLDEGLVAEVRALQERGLGPTASQALGYRQVLEAPPEEDDRALAARIVRATKRFARRQESWFRADPRVLWFDASSADLVRKLAAHLAPRRGPQLGAGGTVEG